MSRMVNGAGLVQFTDFPPEEEADVVPHDWVTSTLGHGEVMCRRCYATNREAAVLGILNRCLGGGR